MKGSASTPSFRHDERHALRHQAGDEGDVSGEAIQLGDNYGALGGSRSSKGCGELRPAVQSVRALTALDLYELLKEGNAFRCGEAGNSRSLELCQRRLVRLPRLEAAARYAPAPRLRPHTIRIST